MAALAAASIVAATGLVLLAPLGLLGGATVVWVFDKRLGQPGPVEAVGHRWTHTQKVETRVLARLVRPCDTLEPGQDVLERTLHERNDGTVEDRCAFETPQWRPTDTEVRTGNGTEAGPPPEVPDDGCDTLGCRRPRRLQTRLDLLMQPVGGGEPVACPLEEAAWRSWRVGDRGTLRFGAITGGPYCDGLVHGG